MKRSVSAVFVSILVLSLLSVGLVSAGWFGDTWNSITGNVIVESENLLVNGDFGSGLASWNQGSGSVVNVSIEDGVAKIYVSAPSEGNCWASGPNPSHCNSIIQTLTGDYNNKKFKVRADLKAPVGVVASLELWAAPWGQNLKSSYKKFNGNGEWQTVELDVLETDDSQDYYLSLRLVAYSPDAAGTTVYWDNVELVEVVEEEDVEIDSCQDISEPGSYILTRDIDFNSNSGACITISSNDVVLEGNDYTISKIGSPTTYVVFPMGILISGTNNTVKNIKLKNFAGGIVVQGDGNSIRNNEIMEVDSIYNHIRGLSIGLVVGTSDNPANHNIFDSNIITGNNYGVQLRAESTGNIFGDNKIEGSLERGVYIYESSLGNEFDNNEICSSGSYDFWCNNAGVNMASGNSFETNANCGSWVDVEKKPCLGDVENVTCTDSDGGLDYYEKGSVVVSVSGPNSGGASSISDVCSDSINLKENFCDYVDGTSFRNYEGYSCPNGCSSGACNEVTLGSCDDVMFRVTNFKLDGNTEEIDLQIYQNSTWTTLCQGKSEGADCYYHDIEIEIDKIYTASKDQVPNAANLNIRNNGVFYSPFGGNRGNIFQFVEGIDDHVIAKWCDGSSTDSCQTAVNLISSPTDLTIDGSVWGLKYNDSWSDYQEEFYYAAFEIRNNYGYDYASVSIDVLDSGSYDSAEQRLENALEH
ncbi:hypothetical protein HN747_01840, partial [archaeon]|nr:hypothetical protein [archaeon]